jgi:hypothetical protein
MQVRLIPALPVGLLALLRNEGDSVGTSLSQTTQEHREQFNLSPSWKEPAS